MLVVADVKKKMVVLNAKDEKQNKGAVNMLVIMDVWKEEFKMFTLKNDKVWLKERNRTRAGDGMIEGAVKMFIVAAVKMEEFEMFTLNGQIRKVENDRAWLGFVTAR